MFQYLLFSCRLWNICPVDSTGTGCACLCPQHNVDWICQQFQFLKQKFIELIERIYLNRPTSVDVIFANGSPEESFTSIAGSCSVMFAGGAVTADGAPGGNGRVSVEGGGRVADAASRRIGAGAVDAGGRCRNQRSWRRHRQLQRTGIRYWKSERGRRTSLHRIEWNLKCSWRRINSISFSLAPFMTKIFNRGIIRMDEFIGHHEV